MSAIELIRHYRRSASSPLEVVDATLRLIAERDRDVNALTTLAPRRDRREASEAAKRYRDGSARPLEGCPCRGQSTSWTPPESDDLRLGAVRRPLRSCGLRCARPARRGAVLRRHRPRRASPRDRSALLRGDARDSAPLANPCSPRPVIAAQSRRQSSSVARAPTSGRVVTGSKRAGRSRRTDRTSEHR